MSDARAVQKVSSAGWWALALVVGCASGGRDGRPDVPVRPIDAALDGAAVDAPLDGASRDGPSFDALADARGVDAPMSRDTGTADLDPRLDVPPPGNEPCSSPGSLSECSGIAVCRFYSSSEGRCESCSACGNLFDPCSGGDDCDILFVCFEGQCTNFCTLGTSECGAPTDCIDVGHPTRGACRPGF